jgi:hypothetical protein
VGVNAERRCHQLETPGAVRIVTIMRSAAFFDLTLPLDRCVVVLGCSNLQLLQQFGQLVFKRPRLSVSPGGCPSASTMISERPGHQ